MVSTKTLNGHDSPVYAIIRGNTDNSFISSSGNGLVVKWTLNSDQGEVVVKVSEAVFSVHLFKQRNLLLLGTEGGGIHVIDLLSEKEIKLFKVHQKGVFSFCEMESGFIISAGGDGTIAIWDPSTLKLIRQIPIAEAKIRDLALSHAGVNLAVALTDGTVRVLDTELFNERHTIKAHHRGANCVAWHPSKPILMTGGRDGHIRAWHTEEEFREVISIAAHEQTVYRIRFNDSDRFASASRDKSAKVWESSSLEMVSKLDHTSQGHTHSVNDCLWMGYQLVTVNDDGLVRVFES